MKQKKLTIGLLCDSLELDELSTYLLKRSENISEFEITTIINHNRSRKTSIDTLYSILRRRGFGYVCRLIGLKCLRLFEGFLLGDRYIPHDIKREDIDLRSKEIVNTSPIYDNQGYRYTYSDEDIHKIKNLNLDVLIRCSSGVISGELLRVTPYGILSLHHGDNRKYRGGPAGFWEILNNDINTGFIIQKLSENLDAGVILCRGSVQTHPLLHANVSRVKKRSYEYMCMTLKNLSYTMDFREDIYVYESNIYQLPSCSNIIKYFIKTLKYYRTVFSQKFGILNKKWHVYYKFIDNPDELELRLANKLKTKNGEFLADPHIIYTNSSYKVLFENYTKTEGRAKISAIDICRETGKLGTVYDLIKEPFHLSFPFSFEHGNQTYLTVESGTRKGIRIYRFLDDGSVVYHHTILDDAYFADPIIFEYCKFWFLLVNQDTGEVKDFNSELNVYRASDPLSGVWTKISPNGILSGAENARNAGLIHIGERVFRVNQIQDVHFYGRGFGLNEVFVSENGEYSEKRKYTTNYLFPDGIEGIHTLDIKAGLLVYDGYK